MSWKDFAPSDPEGLKHFIKYQFNEMIKAGWLTANDEQADIIYDEVCDRTMEELDNYIAEFKRGAGL